MLAIITGLDAWTNLPIETCLNYCHGFRWINLNYRRRCWRLRLIRSYNRIINDCSIFLRKNYCIIFNDSTLFIKNYIACLPTNWNISTHLCINTPRVIRAYNGNHWLYRMRDILNYRFIINCLLLISLLIIWVILLNYRIRFDLSNHLSFRINSILVV